VLLYLAGFLAARLVLTQVARVPFARTLAHKLPPRRPSTL
jgi:hypothetical protein